MPEYIQHLLNTWGQNNTIVAIVSSSLTLITTLIIFFARQIGHLIVSLFKWLWAIITKRGKDYAFEQAYLNWIINQHRYLGLLPARVVTARWGEEGRNVDLEKAYVSLRVFAQGSDKNLAEAYIRDLSYWRKQPSWFFVYLSNLFRFFLGSITVIAYFWYSLRIGLTVIISLLTLYFLIFFINVGLVLIRRYKKETYQLGDLALAIDTHKQLVIRGDPGSGKTTLLRYLAVTCARALRNNKTLGDARDIVEKRLLWNTRPFPILITLRRYSDVAHWVDNKSLIDAYSEEMSTELGKPCPEGFFTRKLAKGNCLILLDAFDELGSVQARASMARRIRNLLHNYDKSDNYIVVTTRIVGYEGQLDHDDFQTCTVQPLTAEEMRALIKQRYKAIALSESAGRRFIEDFDITRERQKRSEKLIEKIECMPRLAQLATNPLLLSLIVLVHRVKIALPEERVLLYRECVEILTDRWQRSKQPESDMQSGSQEELNLSQKLVLLQALALNMQQQREEEDRQTLLPHLQVQEIIANKLPDILGSQLPSSEDECRALCRRKAETWIKSIQTESGILVEQGLDDAGDPLIGFSHLIFQEYLTATAINETPSYQHLLASHLLHPTWSEVVLLYSTLTKLKHVKRDALAQIDDSHFTGAPVVVRIPKQTGSIPSSPKGWEELFASPEWVGAKELQQKLSLLSRVFDYWWFTTFSPHERKFAIGKYPVTNIEYARFVAATGHRSPEYWIEGTYPKEKATHPVTGVTSKDAEAYCQWLSQETGKTYRLPTEWEWEWAATGSQGQQYPWGMQFDQNKCNTEKAAIRDTTPVGSYGTGTNQYGLTDMVGNVWEITKGYSLVSLVESAASAVMVFLSALRLIGAIGLASLIPVLILALTLFLLSLGLLAVSATSVLEVIKALISLPLKTSEAAGLGAGLLLLLGVGLLLSSLLTNSKEEEEFAVEKCLIELLEEIKSFRVYNYVLRGGAFDTPSGKATCFFRGEYLKADKNVGFRCVKEL